jgi:Topoisomerase 6 subunit A/Spo11, Toprim domain
MEFCTKRELVNQTGHDVFEWPLVVLKEATDNALDECEEVAIALDPLFKAARIAEKFDLAIKSTKGMSVTTARQLADEMCSEHNIPLLVLHDFDKAGFSIAGTLQRDTRRYEFQNDITVIDLGFSLADVEAMGLEAEYQHHPKERRSALEENLRTNGASEAEIAFMFRDFDRLRSTRRVELNAMTSPQFVAFVERKLRENGITKVVPDDDVLGEMYMAIGKRPPPGGRHRGTGRTRREGLQAT